MMGVSGTLDGRGVVVTGASSGIGRAIALACAGAGADVVLTYCTNETGAEAVAADIARLGRLAVVLPLDVADPVSVHDLGAAALDRLGRMDVWINNAGADIVTGEGAELADLEKLDRLLSVDLRGTMLASWRAAELLAGQPEGGVIINMSWDHVVTGMAGHTAQLFAAVKGGVQAFSKSLARSVAPRVRVNVLAPGWIETAYGESLGHETRHAIAASTPLGRWGTPQDVAGAAVFLASPAAVYITGHTIVVGGGVVMS